MTDSIDRTDIEITEGSPTDGDTGSGFTPGQAIVLSILVLLNLAVIAVGLLAFLGYLSL